MLVRKSALVVATDLNAGEASAGKTGEFKM